MTASGLHVLTLQHWPDWQTPLLQAPDGKPLQAELLKDGDKPDGASAHKTGEEGLKKVAAGAKEIVPQVPPRVVPDTTRATVKPRQVAKTVPARADQASLVGAGHIEEKSQQVTAAADKPAPAESVQAAGDHHGSENESLAGVAQARTVARSDQKAETAYLPADSDHIESMPARVQEMIQAHIAYPRQARRKGWQGRAVFCLDVHGQRPVHVALLHSSGHALLDRTAMRGIRSVEHLPLASGRYSLPIEFRLQ